MRPHAARHGYYGFRSLVSSTRTPVTTSSSTTTTTHFFLRNAYSSSKPMATTSVRFSPGADESALAPKLQALLSATSGGGGGGGRWTLIANGQGVERGFKFKTFAKTWDFMTAVSLQCKLKNHHPEWSNVYNTTFIRWTTHSPAGLSAKDVELAAICDRLAADFGEIIEQQQQPSQPAAGAGEGEGCALRNLADAATRAAGGDCCKPPPKK